MYAAQKKWWQSAVIYQVYPRSFQDSNGDGIGDLPGLIERLDYLQELGIDAIWLSPVCKSPQADNGYDISDYRDIDPMFGTLADMDRLIAEGKKRGIGIILDLVLNHTSDEHPWFLAAKKSRDDPYHDYYVWRDGEEGTPPNDLRSAFSGSAWEWVPEVQQYYLHQFAVRQPDLNWDNPKVREALYDMIRWWMDRGVAGFRLDAVDLIAKVPDEKILANGPRLQEYFRELSRETFSRGDLVTVGETWNATVDLAKGYSNPDGSEFSMVFQFSHTLTDQVEGGSKWDLAPLDFHKFKSILAHWQTGLHGCGWNSIFWDNHDMPRVVSRWGNDKEYRVESAKMLATVLHGMQGTPYIYQGDELGMTNVAYPLEDYRDIELLNAYDELTAAGRPEEDVLHALQTRGRDNARTPMQWDDGSNAGFTEGEPWIRVNPNYVDINVKAALADPDSVFYCYKKLIALRKEYDVIRDGDFTLLEPDSDELFVYTRSLGDERLLVIANFFGNTVPYDLPEGWDTERADVLIHNYKDFESGTLRPYEAFMLYQKD